MKSPLKLTKDNNYSSPDIIFKEYIDKFYCLFNDLRAEKSFNLIKKYQEESLLNQIQLTLKYEDKIKQLEFKSLNNGKSKFIFYFIQMTKRKNLICLLNL